MVVTRSTFFTSLTTAALMFVGASVWALAPPHNESKDIDCGDCHHLRDNAYGFSDIVTFGKEQEAMCKTCHNPTGVAAAMSDVGTHDVEDGATVVDCGSCHFVHLVSTTTDPHTGGVTAPNLKLIRDDTDRYIPQALTPTIFQTNPEHFSFAETPATGICQTCHTQTDYHTNDGLGPAHNAGIDCKSCHPHDEGFAVACDTCHGNPPVVAVPQGQDGLVVSPAPTGSAIAGAHNAHVTTNGLGCDTCHDDNKFGGLSHISDSTITMSFVLGTNHIGGTYDGQASAGYDTSDPANTTVTNGDTVTCTIYCHSNAQSADGTAEATVYTLPAWDGSALNCTSCHAYPPATGNHVRHYGLDWEVEHDTSGNYDPIDCNTCHAGNNHVDGSIDVKTSLAYTHGGAPGNGYGFCANACHWGAVWGNPSIVWCYDCHGNSEVGDVPPPQVAPTVVPEADIDSTTSVAVTLEWNTAPPSAGWQTQYYAQVSLYSNFSSPMFTLNWTTDTNWTVTLDSSRIWYWRVRARDLARPGIISTWSTDSFRIADLNTPVAPLLINEPAIWYVVDPAPPITITLQWNPVTAPDADPVEYYLEVDTNNGFTSPVTSGWISNTSWDIDPQPDISYYWRVKARDSVHTAFESDWSLVDNFGYLWGGSCPFLYVWDGEKFVFQTDLYGAGKLAAKGKFGYFKSNPFDYYILETNPVVKDDDQYQMRLVEERFETDYLDELKLYMVDVPADRDIYAEKPGFGGTLTDLQDVLHTVAKTKQNPVSITHINTGADVSVQVAESDGDYLVLSNDRNLDFEYQTVELDLGDLSEAPQIKLIINGVTMFPSTPEGAARSALFGPRTKLEVLDENGQWVSVPKTTAELPKPPEFKRAFVLDISDIFQSDVYKVRLTFLFKTYIDSLGFDATEDQTVTLTEVPLASAELRSYGLSDEENVLGDIYNYLYRDNDPNHIHKYFPGNYTRYGDVTPLLDQTDDKFVIYGLGDELDLRFNLPNGHYGGGPQQAKFLMYTNGYYKDAKVDVAHEVEPLPFAAMSGFPYDEAVENYPNDPEHTQYLIEYNTRVE